MPKRPGKKIGILGKAWPFFHFCRISSASSSGKSSGPPNATMAYLPLNDSVSLEGGPLVSTLMQASGLPVNQSPLKEPIVVHQL